MLYNVLFVDKEGDGVVVPRFDVDGVDVDGGGSGTGGAFSREVPLVLLVSLSSSSSSSASLVSIYFLLGLEIFVPH